MKVTEVVFLKRIVTGKYEHEEVTLTAVPDEEDSVPLVLLNLRDLAVGKITEPTVKAAISHEVEEVSTAPEEEEAQLELPIEETE